MAAIIAKLVKEHRERIQRRKRTLHISKSIYQLPAFPEQYDPEKENKVTAFISKYFYALLGNIIVTKSRKSSFVVSVHYSRNLDIPSPPCQIRLKL